MKPRQITLIGMPCAGKTIMGRALATKLVYDFIDLDEMVEKKEGNSLIEIMNTKGAEYFRNMECDFLKEIKPDQQVVISPAGSIIYQPEAMDWIVKNTTVIFLNTPFKIIEDCLATNPKAVQGLKERGLQSIWDERIPLYRKYASKVIDTADKTIPEIVEEIIKNF